MQAKSVAAVVGVALVLGGIGALGYGMAAVGADPASGDCAGDECLGDVAALAFPVGIMAIVFGMIIASWAIGSIRADRGTTGPLSAFGFMTGLGGVFLGLAAIFLVFGDTANDEGAFAFVGILFAVMGLCFVGIDLLRFRGELRKERLRLNGVKGTAKVLGVRDTNVTVNNSPLVRLDLEISIPGQAPFRTTKHTVLSRLTGGLIDGATIPVLADPAKPRSFVLDWDSMQQTSFFGLDDAERFRTVIAPGTVFPAGGGMAAMNPAMSAAALRNVSQVLAAAADREERGLTGSGATDAGAIAPDAATPRPTHHAARSAAAVVAAATPDATGSMTIPAASAIPSALAYTASASPSPAASPVPSDLAPSAPADDVGLPARVTLDGVQDTGVEMNGGRLYAFDLGVSVAGRQPYAVKQAIVVPSALVGRVNQGASFPADIDPANPQQLTVHWDR
jgi:hypothetical protein